MLNIDNRNLNIFVKHLRRDSECKSLIMHVSAPNIICINKDQPTRLRYHLFHIACLEIIIYYMLYSLHTYTVCEFLLEFQGLRLTFVHEFVIGIGWEY